MIPNGRSEDETNAMTIESTATPRRETSPEEPVAPGRLDRWATWLFVGYLVVAAPLLLFVFGDDQWFFGDEWEFIANRSLAPDDLFRQHFGHWVTTPIIAYRVLYWIFGLRSYVPYQALLVASHLTAAWLLFVVMRRVGVRAWIAACATAPFVLFGPGAQNLTWAFQISFNLALVFGLIQLLLAYHDGPIDRRDWLGLAAGAVALTCSAVGPPMVLAACIATFIRRGVRAAAFQALPLAAIFLVWYALARPSERDDWASVRVLVKWMRDSAIAGFEGLGRWTVLSVALAVLLVVGLALRWATTSGAVRRRWFGAPIGLLLGAVAFSAASGLLRASGPGPGARSSRYVYLLAALVLPALAVAAHAVIQRWRATGPIIALLLLVPIVPNLDGFEPRVWDGRYFDGRRELLLALAYDPRLDQVPGELQPDPGIFAFYQVDVDYLRSARAEGRLPSRPERFRPEVELEATLLLGLKQVEAPLAAAATCVTHEKPLRLEPAIGDQLTPRTPVNVAVVGEGGHSSRRLLVVPSRGALEVVLPDLDLRLTPAPGAKSFVLCGP